MELDVNKIMNKLGAQISQQSVQIAALQAQVEMYQEILNEMSKDRGSVVPHPKAVTVDPTSTEAASSTD